MQYRTSRLPSLFVFCAILLLSAPRSEGWQIPKVAAANLTPTLSVSPNPVTARAGQTVTFTAALQPAFRDAAFWFDWGDGTPASNASLNANVSHVFAQAGTFQVVAHARFSKRIINSAPIQVSVRRSLAGDMVVAGTRKVSPAAEIAQTTTTTPTSLVVRANNLAPSVNEAVSFTGSLQPTPNVAVQYQFQWGDNTASDWTSSPRGDHTFAAPGNYNVVLFARAAGAVVYRSTRAPQIQSEPVTISVQAPVITRNLILTSNASELQVGKAANFNGTLRPPVDGARYRFIWGDQTPSNLTFDPNASHSYSAAGIYQVQLLAQIGREQVQSNTLSVEVRNITNYQLDLSANASQVTAGEAIDFTARLEPPNNAARYEFFWDDGTPITTTTSATVPHSFTVAGTHTVNLVGIVDGRRVPGNRVSVTVLPVLSAVSLTANPTSPEVKQSVEFRAALQPENAQAEYQFNWGDGATSKWSTSANQTHVYTTSGTHSALVMARAAKTSVQSAALEIAVHDPPAALAPEKSTDNTGSQKPPPGGNNPAPTPEPLPLRHLPPLSLKVANPSVKPGDSVQVAGSFGAAEQSGAEYKFIFGDGTPAVWSRTPVVMHQFQNAGAYSVYVLGRIRSPEYEPKEKASNALIISVSSPAPSQQTPWGKLAVAFLFALGMAATTWRTFVRVKVRVKPPPAPELRVTSGPVPVPEIRVRVVLGEVTHDTARYKEAVNKR